MAFFPNKHRPVARLIAGLALTASCISCGTTQPQADPATASAASVEAAQRGPAEPTSSPWEQLTEQQAVFSSDEAGSLCPPDTARRFLVLTADATHRRDLAASAGCSAVPLEGHYEIELCCPTGLDAPLATRHGEGPSCSAATEEHAKNLSGEKLDPPGATASTYARTLNPGTYLETCNVPDGWGVRLCAVVQNGSVVGVDVRTVPASADEADCIAAAVRAMRFEPAHPGLDMVRTTFAPVK